MRMEHNLPPDLLFENSLQRGAAADDVFKAVIRTFFGVWIDLLVIEVACLRKARLHEASGVCENNGRHFVILSGLSSIVQSR